MLKAVLPMLGLAATIIRSPFCNPCNLASKSLKPVDEPSNEDPLLAI